MKRKGGGGGGGQKENDIRSVIACCGMAIESSLRRRRVMMCTVLVAKGEEITTDKLVEWWCGYGSCPRGRDLVTTGRHPSRDSIAVKTPVHIPQCGPC